MRTLPLLLLLTACGGPGASRPPAASRDTGPAPSSSRFDDRVSHSNRGTYPFFEAGSEVGPTEEGRRPVARLEVVLPAQDPFVLHATVPVPEGTWPRTDGRQPLAVVHPGGQPIPAQTHPLTRSVSGEAQVLAVRALLPHPEGRRPGDRIRVDLVEGSFEPLPGPPRLVGPAAPLVHL